MIRILKDYNLEFFRLRVGYEPIPIGLLNQCTILPRNLCKFCWFIQVRSYEACIHLSSEIAKQPTKPIHYKLSTTKFYIIKMLQYIIHGVNTHKRQADKLNNSVSY